MLLTEIIHFYDNSARQHNITYDDATKFKTFISNFKSSLYAIEREYTDNPIKITNPSLDCSYCEIDISFRNKKTLTITLEIIESEVIVTYYKNHIEDIPYKWNDAIKRIDSQLEWLVSSDTSYEIQENAQMGKFKKVATAIGAVVDEKNKNYGDSFKECVQFLKLLYPNGISVEQYGDILALARIWDKCKRIATKKDAMGENPFADIAGYAILGVANDLDTQEKINNFYKMVGLPHLIDTHDIEK